MRRPPKSTIFLACTLIILLGLLLIQRSKSASTPRSDRKVSSTGSLASSAKQFQSNSAPHVLTSNDLRLIRAKNFGKQFGPDFLRLYRNLNGENHFSLVSAQLELVVRDRIAAFLRSVQLLPAQERELENLLVKRELADLSAGLEIYRAGRFDNDSARLGELISANQSAVDSQKSALDEQISALLGPVASAKFREFTQSLPQRDTVDFIRNSIEVTSPLSDSQVTELVRAISEYSQDKLNLSGSLGLVYQDRTGFQVPKLTVMISDEMIDEVSQNLSSDQIDNLHEMQRAQDAYRQLILQSRPGKFIMRDVPIPR